jgi:putative addiction module CopG family antidote
MNITLSPELQKFVEEKVKAGEFQSAAQVVEAGLARAAVPSVNRGGIR